MEDDDEYEIEEEMPDLVDLFDLHDHYDRQRRLWRDEENCRGDDPTR